jgi:lipopolysaccharide biosynthesis regulator YciM
MKNQGQVINRWEKREGRMFYRCGECGRRATKSYKECPGCHTIMTNGDIAWDTRRKNK